VILSQTSSTENVAICTKLVLFLCSSALHEFPNDIFTNEDRRQGAVVLHVLCVSTSLIPLSLEFRGQKVGGKLRCLQSLPSLLSTRLIGAFRTLQMQYLVKAPDL
jgi:hypothetical protein